MAYIIHFFTSDETNEVGCTLESSKLNNAQLSDFKLVRAMKYLIGNDEHLPDSTYARPIITPWKDFFISTMKEWAVLFPKLNEVIGLVSKLEEGSYLGVSFNETLSVLEKKKVLLDILERETGVPAKQQYEEYLHHNEMLLRIYEPESYSYENRIRFGPQIRKHRVCRYCGKMMPETTFKHDSHTISKSLGNISFFTNDECDTCNAKFGADIEQELVRYISIYRTLAARFEGHPYYTTQTDSFRLGVDEATNQICFDILDKSKTIIKTSDKKTDISVDGGFIDYHKVYRCLVKYVIGMLSNDQLPLFKETISWVNGEHNIINLPIVKYSIYNEPVLRPYMNMFFRKEKSQEYPYLVADFHVNHLEFLYVIPGCSEDMKEIKEDIINVFLKLNDGGRQWHNLVMNCPQPTHMNLRASFYLK